MYRALAQNASQTQDPRRGLSRARWTLFPGVSGNRTATTTVPVESAGKETTDCLQSDGLHLYADTGPNNAVRDSTVYSAWPALNSAHQSIGVQQFVAEDSMHQNANERTQWSIGAWHNVQDDPGVLEISNGTWDPQIPQELSTMCHNNYNQMSEYIEAPLPSRLFQNEPSVKRAVPAGAPHNNERPLKSARLLAHVTSPSDIHERDEDVVMGESHKDAGRDENNKFCCECGKKYTARSRLRGHIEGHHGVKHKCPECGKLCSRKDVANAHCKDRKVACPTCGARVRKDALRSHKGSRNGQCGIAVPATLDYPPQEGSSKCQEPTSGFWKPEVSSEHNTETIVRLTDRSHSKATRSAQPTSCLLSPRSIGCRDVVDRFREPCNICHEPFGITYDDLETHNKKHLEEFALRQVGCDICQIRFAQRKDLDRHLAAAAKGHCGLNFDHERCFRPDEKGLPPGRRCSGHHPPFEIKTSLPTNHDVMQRRLWEWEQCQLHALRIAVKRNRASLSHRSMDENAVSSLRPASTFSHASLKSFQSVPAHLRYMDRANADSLVPDLEMFGVSDPQLGTSDIDTSPGAQSLRPDSMVLGPIMGQMNSDQMPKQDLTEPVMPLDSLYADGVRSLRKPSDMVMRRRSGAVGRSSIQLAPPPRLPKMAYVRSTA